MRLRLFGICLVGVCTLGACDSSSTDDAAADAATGTSGDPELVEFLSETYGLRIFQLESEQEVDGDGRTMFTERHRVELRGYPDGEIELLQLNFPAAEGGGINLTVTDLETQETRIFGWDIGENGINFTRQLNDGTPPRFANVFAAMGRYSVVLSVEGEEDRVESDLSGRQAVDLVDEFIDFGSAPPRVTMAAFAIAHTSPPEARAVTNCTIQGVAATPPICDIFSAFCDCVPCRVVDRPELCARCPED